jgi:hypothetical protein
VYRYIFKLSTTVWIYSEEKIMKDSMKDIGKGIAIGFMLSVAALAASSVFAWVICNPDAQLMCMYW